MIRFDSATPHMFFQGMSGKPVYWFGVPEFSNEAIMLAFIVVLGTFAIVTALVISHGYKKKVRERLQVAHMNWLRAKWRLDRWIVENPEISTDTFEAQNLIHRELGLLMVLCAFKPLSHSEQEREEFLIAKCKKDFVMSLPK